ncbi:MAG: zinc-dependent alcohol dehydrogenase [Anaerolineae bacterium]|jgi:L-iditol 2-dehydrogenase|nr:galactitol-1-phosphate 5-dehydrogenase [Chloroflexota bacterium]
MKALVHTAPYVVEYTDWPKPEAGPEDLLVRVRSCAICGSDIKGYSGSTGRRQPPIIMGHEAAGVVEAIGEKVVGFTVGDRVTFDSTIYCRLCYFCQTGHPNLCDHREVIGVSEGTYRRHGAMAEYVTVPYWVAVRMPEGLSFAQASLVETASVGVHAANRTPLTLNDTVVIVGAGAVGLVALQAMRLKGAGRVIVTDLSPARLEMARSMGADVTIEADAPDLMEQLLAATGPRGADATLEAVGIQPTFETALAITRKGGSLTLIGNVAQQISMALQSIVSREITIYGVCANNGEIPACVELIASGRLNVDPFISEFASLEDGQAVFDRLYKGVEGNIRTLFTFE